MHNRVTLANIDVDDTYIVRFVPSNDPEKLLYEHEGNLIEAEVVTETIQSKDSQAEEYQIIYVRILVTDFLLLIERKDKIWGYYKRCIGIERISGGSSIRTCRF